VQTPGAFNRRVGLHGVLEGRQQRCSDLFQCLGLIVLGEFEEILSHAPLRCRLPEPSRTAKRHGQRLGRATRYEEVYDAG
jgi:hypothetical protein